MTVATAVQAEMTVNGQVWHAVSARDGDRTLCGIGRMNWRSGWQQNWDQTVQANVSVCKKCALNVARIRASGNTPQRTIRVPQDEWNAAKAAADANGETISDVIRAALKRYVSRKGQK